MAVRQTGAYISSKTPPKTIANGPSTRFIRANRGIIAGNGDKEAWFDQLTYRAFGEVLAQVPDYAYIDGPNATFRQDNGDGIFYGEFWVL